MDTFPPRVSVSAFCEIRLQAINLRGQADTGRQDGFGPCTSALRSWSWGAGRAKKAGKARLGGGESVGRLRGKQRAGALRQLEMGKAVIRQNSGANA